MKKRTTSILKQLIVNILTPVIISLILLALLNYFNTKRILINSFEEKNQVISDEVKLILQFQDIALDILEERLETKLNNYSENLINKYFETTDSIETTDLDEVRKQLGMDSILEDIYIINSDGIIVNTTFKEDKGLNLFNFGEQHKQMLLDIMRNQSLLIERFALETKTNRLKKYSYQGTKDSKYIVEIGTYSNKADEIIRFVKDNLHQIEKNQENILFVDIFIDPENPISLNRNYSIRPEHLNAFRNVIETKESRTVVEEIDNKQIHHQYIFMGREKSSLYKNSIIYIASDLTVEMLLLRSELYKSLIVFGSTIIIILLLFYNKIRILTNPVKSLLHSMQNIIRGQIKERTQVTGNNEITELASYFNQMLDQLEDNYNDLLKAKLKAEQADKLKSAFLANMSHEIRTPMNAIIGFSDLMIHDEYSKEETQEFLKLINENAKSLLDLINDIIDIAKIESGQLKIFENPCPINKIMKDLTLSYQQVKARLGKEHLEIRMKSEIDDEDFLIIIDELRFKQIMTNLVNNAIKFTKQGYIEFGLTIKDPITMLFYVKDTGIGIPQNKQKIIFERFRQADDSHTREYGGTGLGLAITKNLLEILGGKVWVESEKDQGTTFYFTLPLKTVSKEDSEAIINRFVSDKSLLKNNWSDIKVLVAEDEDTNYKLLEAILRDTNIQLTRARNGEIVLEHFEIKNKFDLILMDIKMPKLNGYETAKILKNKYKTTTPIIAQTAYAMSSEKEEILQSGFDDYISKPIKAEELLKIIGKHIKK